MKRTMVRYKVKADRAAENENYIKKVTFTHQSFFGELLTYPNQEKNHERINQ